MSVCRLFADCLGYSCYFVYFAPLMAINAPVVINCAKAEIATCLKSTKTYAFNSCEHGTLTVTFE